MIQQNLLTALGFIHSRLLLVLTGSTQLKVGCLRLIVSM